MDLSALDRHTPRGVTGAPREAAVLAPVLHRNGEPHLLFTKRADHLGEHPGQMSFPGGGREPGDETLRDTALREADEEIGLTADEVDVVGRIDDITTVTDYAVRPFVATVADREYVPDEREVAEIAVLAVDDLTDPANYESERRETDYGSLRIHYFSVDGYTVWGATGRMVAQLLELTTDWRIPEQPDRIVGPDADVSP
ncbi:NUDIX hydrolase [Halopenitus persicus]|uniref:8-oxo-dGTP pyrophosphatase MutT, NUDIX family n=1 Tax=Halopenitus persicus TaxID=1048396 RepID=A0A1H3IIA7_9EURY|nr:CoA pyrophosphatase [Halopenitus persicus]QHS17119.1 CoA pyrophosphatase [haloarchaeon 3A1-DGR]SDY27411.1 8-oxo-dGTP pyrophosphatase MutT, NUDIX family [Halopenitus persicus]